MSAATPTASAVATPAVTVRNAHDADVPWIVAELKEFAAYYGMPALFRGAEHVARVVREHLADQHFRIAEVGGVPVGFLAALYTAQPDSGLPVLMEKWWWVRPGHRASGVGGALLDDFVAAGRWTGHAPTMSLVGDQSIIPETVLIARGFRLVERVYALEVTP